jgi:hypothetical protein
LNAYRNKLEQEDKLEKKKKQQHVSEIKIRKKRRDFQSEKLNSQTSRSKNVFGQKYY